MNWNYRQKYRAEDDANKPKMNENYGLENHCSIMRFFIGDRAEKETNNSKIEATAAALPYV